MPYLKTETGAMSLKDTSIPLGFACAMYEKITGFPNPAQRQIYGAVLDGPLEAEQVNGSCGTSSDALRLAASEMSRLSRRSRISAPEHREGSSSA